MANGVNRAIILGRLGVDPETRFTAGGNAVTNLRVATSESWKDRETGEQKEATEWHRVVLFGKVAEIAGQYLTKGSQVYIEGKIQTRKWQDNEGNDRWTTEIVGREMTMLGKGGGQQEQGGAPAESEGDTGLDESIPF